jgi:hypothetical protein
MGLAFWDFLSIFLLSSSFVLSSSIDPLKEKSGEPSIEEERTKRTQDGRRRKT